MFRGFFKKISGSLWGFALGFFCSALWGGLILLLFKSKMKQFAESKNSEDKEYADYLQEQWPKLYQNFWVIVTATIAAMIIVMVLIGKGVITPAPLF